MSTQPPDAVPGSGLPPGLFPTRLDAAIRRRGLSLQRLCAHLAAEGVACSPATLSQWRHGRTRPRAADAADLLRALERVLRTPPGYLTEAEHPPRGTGLADGETPPPPPSPLTRHRQYAEFSALLGDGIFHAFHPQLSLETVHVDAQRRITGSRVLQVLQALRDDAERYIVGTFPSGVTSVQATPSADLPPGVLRSRLVRPVRGTRLGRRRIDDETGIVLHEMVLEAPVRRGDLVAVEFEIHPAVGPEPPTTPWQHWQRRASTATRQLVLSVEFSPDAPPAHVHRITAGERSGAGPDGSPRPLPEEHAEITPVPSRVTASRRDLNRGAVGFAWSWDADPAPCICTDLGILEGEP